MGRHAGPVTPPEPNGEVVGGIEDGVEAASQAPGEPRATAPRRGSPLRHLARFTSGRRGPWLMLAALGPGLIAANAGNDAGGIATYASVGAKYGYDLLWMFPLILISLAVVQEMAARMGAATGKGLSDLIRENFSIHVTAFVLLALLIANGGTVVTEFIGIAASIDLVLPGAQFVALPLIALGIWLMVVKGNYSSIERVFLAMTLVFFAYPISAVLAHPNWGEAARHTVMPTFHFNQTYLLLFVATVGTSITPYMQVYVQSTVADKGITARDYRAERIEVYAGSLFANLIAVFIVIATAATLFPHHEAVQSAQDAARALGPIAGSYAKYLFAVGLFGASMLAAAVLPLATAYSIAEAMGVEKGVNRGFREAPVFMGLFTGLMVLGVAIALIPSLPVIQVLVAVQAVDCLLLPVVLIAILRLINMRRLMGDLVNGPIYNVIARTTAVVVTILSLVLLGTTVLQLFGVSVG
jgi:Mn2+/Fe2+ NRAMP family transporter